MAFYVKADSDKDYETVEPGLHQAVCSHFLPMGLEETPWGDKPKIALCFELADKMKDGRPFMLTKMYTASLHKKANLRKEMESWRGKTFTEDQLKGFDMEAVVGANCYLNISHNVKDDKTYTNINGIMPLPKGIPAIKAVGQPAPKWLLERQEKGLAIERAATEQAAKQEAAQDEKSAQVAASPVGEDDLPF